MVVPVPNSLRTDLCHEQSRTPRENVISTGMDNRLSTPLPYFARRRSNGARRSASDRLIGAGTRRRTGRKPCDNAQAAQRGCRQPKATRAPTQAEAVRFIAATLPDPPPDNSRVEYIDGPIRISKARQ